MDPFRVSVMYGMQCICVIRKHVNTISRRASSRDTYNAPGFADKAKPAVVEKARNELAESKEKLAGVLAALDKLPAE